MNITQAVQNKVNTMPAGQVFGYQELPNYGCARAAVLKAVSRMVSDRKIERLSKGKFYVPKTGVLGPRKPTDSELIRSMLYKNGRLRGYITGPALYNRLGLTTQVPRTITLALNGGRQEKDFGTIRIKTVIARTAINEQDVKLLQYLDVLQDIKNIPDTTTNLSLKIMKRNISGLSQSECDRFTTLAVNYYGAQVRALLGMLFSCIGKSVPARLKQTLNPTTTYKLKLDQNIWPMAKDWNIQ
jgi:hypothetical protein